MVERAKITYWTGYQTRMVPSALKRRTRCEITNK